MKMIVIGDCARGIGEIVKGRSEMAAWEEELVDVERRRRGKKRPIVKLCLFFLALTFVFDG